MPTYSSSRRVRTAAHDVIDTRICGGRNDDTSLTSLDIGDKQPRIAVVENTVQVYYGQDFAYRLRKLSDMETDDIVYSPSGHIVLSTNVQRLYKEFTRALNDKLFCLSGVFDCPNIFTGTPQNVPEVQADVLFPYYFRENCGLKGIVEFNKLAEEDGSAIQGGISRAVRIVNVNRENSLIGHIPENTFIYLGGQHNEEDLKIMPEFDNCRFTKYARFNEREQQLGPGGADDLHWIVSSPFPKTRAGFRGGLNIGFCKFKTGEFGYWGTYAQPPAGKQIGQLCFTNIPADGFPQEYGWNRNDRADLHNLYEGAWVMRGDCLLEAVDEGMYPSGVLDRLRSGFFHQGYTDITISYMRIYAKLRKAIESLRLHKSSTLGFRELPGGVYEGSLCDFASFVRIPVEYLAAFIAGCGLASSIFQGQVTYGSADMFGPLKVLGATPVGKWMKGRLVDTGCGLLYNVLWQTYFEVDTIENVSRLYLCTETRRERCSLNLGQLIV